MYLKRIEVQGFKSFAHKIIFDFHEGITGIVGPNGSGKSNVSDAVRWVLGEQSAKQLRGGNMQDVIFAGTQLRKAQGYAYVMITFDNADKTLAIDFDEVSVSRRIYRSGESEYMINGSPCRLKDVQEIFYDTGIGKDGYSIIGQGQVDKILSGKTEERRELFDEAAGITKYKRRKAVAIKKLENERANLVRISDILSELEKQVGPLERQSKTAREYLLLKEELKRYESNNFLIESEELRRQLEEFSQNDDILQEDYQKAKQESDRISEKYNTVIAHLEELDFLIGKKRNDLAEANRVLGEQGGKINLLHEQIRHTVLSLENIEKRLKSIDTEIDEKNTAMNNYEKEQTELKKQLDAVRSVLEDLTFSSDETVEEIEQAQELLEQYRSGKMSSISEKSELMSRQQKYLTLIEQVQIRLSEISARILKAKAENLAFHEREEKENRKLEELSVSAEKNRQALEQLNLDLTSAQAKLSALEDERNKKRNLKHGLKARLESLRNIAERYEGYGSSVKKVMEQKEKGVHGVIADLISVKKGFETAIETALGSRIQNIVTDREEIAKKLIEYLKRNKLGRATFLPLSSVGTNEIENFGPVLQEKGVVGPATELIETGSIYRPMLNALIGKILIVDHIDHAIAIERKYNYRYRIVTIDGESLSPGGALSGGAYKNTGSLLGRKREFSELEEQIQSINKELANLDAGFEEGQSRIQQKVGQSEKLKSLLQEDQIQINASMLELKNLQAQIQSCDTLEAELETERKEQEDSKVQLLSEKKQVDLTLSGLEVQGEDMENEISLMSAKLEELRARRDKQREEHNEQNLKAQAMLQKNEFIRENLERIQKELTSLVDERIRLLASGDEMHVQSDEREQEIERTKEEMKQNEAIISDLNLELEELSAKKEKENAGSRQFFEEKNAILEQMSSIEKEIFRIANRKERAEERRNSLVNYMWNEYEMTLASALMLKDEAIIAEKDCQKQIDQRKAEIRKLGSVNVNAIEEYKEISERYDLMKTQHDDIIEAENQLTKIIEDLDTGMRIQFEEKFKQIQEQFNIVFRELFGGGTGKLEIEEDVDILEASISVISQPPGKKLQNMMQLSGGEKALTAISLLFAIQNLKPSPFALLDEIEAALDDSNVERFAKYLHKLTKRTQFIVITHRRGTMVNADRLYGITMQEKGVSTLVSVNLVEDALT